MLSVCTGIYRDAISLEIFVRSLFGNASNPKDIELIIYNDEGHIETEQVLNSLTLEFPQIKHFVITKNERIDFFMERIEFYKKENIFEKDIINDMYKQVEMYKADKTKNLWYSPGRVYNKAIHKATGDMLMILPSDYLIFFDATKIYELAKKLKPIVGHFDWIDFSSVDFDVLIDFSPVHSDVIKEFKKFNCHNDFRNLSRKWLDRAKKRGLITVPLQHGSRIIDRETFEKVGSFDERWFLRAVADDEFNRKVSNHSSLTRLGDNSQFEELMPYIGCIRQKDYQLPFYLTSFYVASATVHSKFLDKIRPYL